MFYAPVGHRPVCARGLLLLRGQEGCRGLGTEMTTLPPSQGHAYGLLKRWPLDSVAAICVAEALTSSEACQTSVCTLTWCVGSATGWLRST